MATAPRSTSPLPYIDEKPNPILIHVGRQLFVDDFLIEETDLERVCHHANLYSGNPVIADGLTYSDGVWYDEVAGKFKMWYNNLNYISIVNPSTGIITLLKFSVNHFFQQFTNNFLQLSIVFLSKLHK